MSENNKKGRVNSALPFFIQIWSKFLNLEPPACYTSTEQTYTEKKQREGFRDTNQLILFAR